MICSADILDTSTRSSKSVLSNRLTAAECLNAEPRSHYCYILKIEFGELNVVLIRSVDLLRGHFRLPVFFKYAA
ncbi:hypothetical protein SAMN05444172_8175 [Burkholderia sp. GAS332]|nr:hypothetical protein SAMN05444172_8175 [Burkholderia sp. GAS332]